MYNESDLRGRFEDFVSKRSMNIGTDTIDDFFKKLDLAVTGHPFNSLCSSPSSRQAVDVPAHTGAVDTNRTDPNTLELHDHVPKDLKTEPFWVSISGKRGFRRLHRTGGCWFSSASWEWAADLKDLEFDARCGHCWKEDAVTPMKLPDINGEDESIGATDESSSTDAS